MQSVLPVRRVRPDLSGVPRHWAGGDAQLTHVLNGLFALFPDGELFFVRSVRAFEGRTTVAQARLRGFYGQEANHGAAHRDAFRMLERQGYEIEGWLAWYRQAAYGGVESRTPAFVGLATTAALEHFTATLAEVAFDPDDDLIARCHPAMRELICWHAAEEIEHRSVAFDVLTEIDPRLRTRWVGFAIAVGTLTGFGMSAAHHLGRQDGLRGTRRRFLTELARRPRVLRTALRFCRRGFHPDEAGPHEPARRYLEGVG